MRACVRALNSLSCVYLHVKVFSVFFKLNFIKPDTLPFIKSRIMDTPPSVESPFSGQVLSYKINLFVYLYPKNQTFYLLVKPHFSDTLYINYYRKHLIKPHIPFYVIILSRKKVCQFGTLYYNYNLITIYQSLPFIRTHDTALFTEAYSVGFYSHIAVFKYALFILFISYLVICFL